MDVQTVTVPQQWVAFRTVTCPREKVGETITGSLGPVYELAGKHSAEPGAPYARFLDCTDTQFRIQVGALIRHGFEPSGDVSVDLYPAHRAVRVICYGRYGEMQDAYREGEAHIEAESLVVGGPVTEVYDGPPNAEGIAKVIHYWPVQP